MIRLYVENVGYIYKTEPNSEANYWGGGQNILWPLKKIIGGPWTHGPPLPKPMLKVSFEPKFVIL